MNSPRENKGSIYDDRQAIKCKQTTSSDVTSSSSRTSTGAMLGEVNGHVMEMCPFEREFPFFAKLSAEIQFQILQQTYCTEPWQLSMSRDHRANSTTIHAPEIGPKNLLRCPRYRDVIDATVERSRNGSLLLPAGCTWDVEDDVQNLQGLRACLNAITTLILEDKIGSIEYISYLRSVMPNLKVIELGSITKFEDRIIRATRAMLTEIHSHNGWDFGLFYLDDLVQGEYDQYICDMVQKCLQHWIEDMYGRINNYQMRFPWGYQVNITVGIPDTSLYGTYFTMSADFIMMDLVIENDKVKMTKKWFVDIEDHKYPLKFALEEWDIEDPRDCRTRADWEYDAKIDNIGRFMPITILRKTTTLLTGDYFNPTA